MGSLDHSQGTVGNRTSLHQTPSFASASVRRNERDPGRPTILAPPSLVGPTRFRATICPGDVTPDVATASQKTRGRTVRLARAEGRQWPDTYLACSWCTGCKREIPWFIEFDRKYGGRGLITIGVAMDDEGWPLVKPYLVEHPIPYHIVIGSVRVAERFKVTNMPVTLLIDREGRIAEQHVGVVDKDAWEHKIQELLQERTNAPGRTQMPVYHAHPF
jgi:cytochrome c biogenesis protein CcmG/thiol:disulfide interchange protein DsbE